MSQYKLNNSKYGTHKLIAEEIGVNKIVLDVGCNKGYMRDLAPENKFYGIELNSDDTNTAKQKGYEEVFIIDLNNFTSFVFDKKFEVIIFADILEHLIFPEKVLKFFIENYLVEGGRVIISLPNVANIVTRLNLLVGNFDYTDSGILDKTHLHLYTEKTGAFLVEECGLRIIKKKYSSNNFGLIIKKFSFLGELLGYNLIFVCQRKY